VTRTVNLAASFATAFELASYVVVSDIYDAGEANPAGVTGELLVPGIRRHAANQSVQYAPTFDDVLADLEALHDQCDVVLLLGAGDIATIARDLRGGLDA
jgi:UDP-N-acetylmuramate--alanine ligase